MTNNANAPISETGFRHRFWTGQRWRIAGWSVPAILLLLPAAAMQFTDEVKWGPGDFLAIGTVLAVAGGIVELGARVSRHFAYRLGMFVAVVTGVLMVWINLAVGILGNEDDPANLLFFGVLTVAAAGSWAAKFQPAGMARAFQATTAVQLWVGLLIATAGPAGGPMPDRVRPLVLIGAFALLWLFAALLFGKVAREDDKSQRRG